MLSCTKEILDSNTNPTTEPPIEQKVDVEKIKLNSGITITKIDSLYYFEGDILLTDNQITNIDQSLTKSAFISDFIGYWPNSIIYYTFNPNVPSSTQDFIRNVINQMDNLTSLKFIPRTTQNDYVEIKIRTDGKPIHSSNLGYIGGKQSILLANYDIVASWDIEHEIGHTIGLLHEHSRSDRDSYISINYSNIDPEYIDQFNISPLATNHGPFDFSSVMLYSSRSFAIDPSTNTIIDNNSPTRQWSGLPLSQGDIDGIEFIYSGVADLVISESPDSYYYYEYGFEEWNIDYDNTLIFYSDASKTSEQILNMPRQVKYTLSTTTNSGYNLATHFTYHTVVVPSGVSRYHLPQTKWEGREVQSNVEYWYQTTISLPYY